MGDPKVVLVTGCSHGLGTYIAMQFASDPRKCYKVWAAVRCEEEKDVMTKMAAEYLGTTLDLCVIDLTKKEEIESTVNMILKKSGRVDILVCNAGMSYFCPVEHLDIKKGRRNMQINFHGHARIMHMLIPGMKERRYGRIINIGSVGAIGGISLFGDFFVASKCAMESLNVNLNAQLRPYNIRLSVIQPSAMKTDNVMNVLQDGNYKDLIHLPDDTDALTKTLFKQQMEVLGGSFSTKHAQEPIEVAKLVKTVVEDEASKALYQTCIFGTYACKGWLKDTTDENMVKRIRLGMGLS